MISDPYDIAVGREIAETLINQMNHDLQGTPLQEYHEDTAHHAEPLFGPTRCGHCDDELCRFYCGCTGVV
jgi:hypothetical protein